MKIGDLEGEEMFFDEDTGTITVGKDTFPDGEQGEAMLVSLVTKVPADLTPEGEEYVTGLINRLFPDALDK